MDVDAMDINWLHEETRLHNLHGEMQKEKPDKIRMNFVYLNRSDYINQILSEDYVFPATDLSGSRIPLDNLLKIIQTHKLRTPTSQYRLVDIRSYIVDIDAVDVQSYSECNNNTNDGSSCQFFKEEVPTRDLLVPDSLFVFHNINAIYFVYHEIETEIQRHNLQSILKREMKQTLREPGNKSTKKVRIEDKNHRKSPLSMRRKGTRKRSRR